MKIDMTEILRTRFAYICFELMKIHKRTKLAHGMGYTTTRQLDNSLEGKAMLSTQAIFNLVSNFNVNPTYLFTGSGNMFLNQPEPQNRLEYNYISSTM